jgi:hypothetical protein
VTEAVLLIVEASQLIEAGTDKNHKRFSNPKRFRRMSLKKVKQQRPIILIGGDYSSPRAEYMTPMGKLAGE